MEGFTGDVCMAYTAVFLQAIVDKNSVVRRVAIGCDLRPSVSGMVQAYFAADKTLGGEFANYGALLDDLNRSKREADAITAHRCSENLADLVGKVYT